MRGLISAIRTLTIVRIPGKDSANMSQALNFFPLAGLLVGVVVAGTGKALGCVVEWSWLGAVGCLVASSWITGGMHLDGVADVFDSMGAVTKERRLEIMKDSRVGSFGAIALVLLLMIKLVAMREIVDGGAFTMLVVPFVVSRAVTVEMMFLLPYARKEGGMGAAFFTGATKRHLAVALVAAALLCAGLSGWHGVGILGVAAVGVLPLLLWVYRTFDGGTGDTVGLVSEIVEATCLLWIAAGHVGGAAL